MADHYYSGSPESHRQTRDITVSARGVELRLSTDNGVFSKTALDEGTRRLVECVALGETDRVLDLGAGYGPVAAILGSVYKRTMWALVDINERATELASENTLFMASRRSVYTSDGIPAEWGMQFDAVILNPPIRAGKAVVYRLFRDAYRVLSSGGTLWIVIQKKHGALTAQSELEKIYESVEVVYKKKGYFIIAAKKH